jgi:predicted enzyme related to lactoylglutathione lyase
VHVILAVEDVGRSVSFYEAAFGWPRNDRIDYENYIELHQPDGGTLGLFQRDGFAQEVGADGVARPNGAQTATEIYVRLDDVEPALDRLRELGARPLRDLEQKSWGDETAYFADPDGNVVGVAQLRR